MTNEVTASLCTDVVLDALEQAIYERGAAKVGDVVNHSDCRDAVSGDAVSRPSSRAMRAPTSTAAGREGSRLDLL